jgi:hypothetical protein
VHAIRKSGSAGIVDVMWRLPSIEARHPGTRPGPVSRNAVFLSLIVLRDVGASVNTSPQGRIYRSKKARIWDDSGGPRSESAFSLNWITSCLLTIRQSERIYL